MKTLIGLVFLVTLLGCDFPATFSEGADRLQDFSDGTSCTIVRTSPTLVEVTVYAGPKTREDARVNLRSVSPLQSVSGANCNDRGQVMDCSLGDIEAENSQSITVMASGRTVANSNGFNVGGTVNWLTPCLAE